MCKSHTFSVPSSFKYIGTANSNAMDLLCDVSSKGIVQSRSITVEFARSLLYNAYLGNQSMHPALRNHPPGCVGRTRVGNARRHFRAAQGRHVGGDHPS